MNIYIKYLFCLFSFLGTAQNQFSKDSVPATQISLLNTDYKNFVSVKNIIFALTKNNDLVQIDFKNDNFKIIKSNTTAIAKKSNDELILGSKDGKIFIYKKNGKIKQIDKVDAEIFSILINSEDEYIVYSNKSIYYNKTDYKPQKATNFYGKVRAKHTGTQLIEPDFIYLDKMNFLWFAFDEGEWGGNVCFFDLNKKEFIYDHWLTLDDDIKYEDRNDYFTKLKETYSDKIKITEQDTIYKYPYQMSISSVTKGVAYDNNNNLYISSSGKGHTMIYKTINGFHYSIDGTMVRISNPENGFSKSCFDENFLDNNKENKSYAKLNLLTSNQIDLLGSLTFNKFDKNLYCYSSKGFHKLINNDCHFSREFIFKPNLDCYETCKEYCVHLNVLKFEFISKKEILFLTKKNGIGYYNGDKVKYLK